MGAIRLKIPLEEAIFKLVYLNAVYLKWQTNSVGSRRGICDEIDHARSPNSVRDFNRRAALIIGSAGPAKPTRQSQIR